MRIVLIDQLQDRSTCLLLQVADSIDVHLSLLEAQYLLNTQL